MDATTTTTTAWQNAITETSEEGFRKKQVTSEALYSEQQVKSQSSGFCCVVADTALYWLNIKMYLSVFLLFLGFLYP